MSGSRFWNWATNLTPGSFARAEAVDANFSAINAALALIEAELNRCIRFTAGGTPLEADFQIPDTAGQRASKTISFGATGLPVMANAIWNYRGTWAPSILYAVNDVISLGTVPVTGLYVCNTAHTSSAAFATDLASKWNLLIDLTDTNRAIRSQKIITAAQSPYIAAVGEDLLIDVSGGSITVNLPPSPLISDQAISFTHIDGSIASNNLLVGRNGQNIMGLAQNMTVADPNAAFELAFSDAARGWRLVRGT
jgi:hypothetical protein